jgi:gamma-glutamyltranspeptidase/glutathione hydrolase
MSSLASEGVRLNQYQVQCFNRLAPKLSVSPESKRIYVKPDGHFKNGDIIRNPNLAKTFITLAKEGEKSFYEGSIAEQIERDITENGGFLSVKDLKSYTIKEVQPIFTEIKGKKVWTVPPEGGGAVLIEILNILNRERFFNIKPFTPEFYHFLAQACKIASIDRCDYLGDIKLNRNRAYKNIFNRDYIDRMFSIIDSGKDIRTDELVSLMRTDEEYKPDLKEKVRGSNETTHFSIIDRDGNAVSNSYTLNLRYGSKWSVDGAGFLLNGSIDAFAFYPGEPNYFGVVGNKPNMFGANKKPVSYMSPVIVTDSGRIEMIIGSPGGPAIPSALAQLIIAVLGHNSPPHETVRQLRIHHQAWPDILYQEKDEARKATFRALSKMGYDIKEKDEPIGDIHGIFAKDGEYCAVCDYRREGRAMAY